MPTLALLSLLVLAGDLRRETWPDGSPRAEYEVVAGATGREERSGAWRAWHENGALASEGTFAQDRETGRWKFFHANGARAAEGNYARGERTGMWETFHADGTRASRGRYEKDRRVGEWTFLDERGRRDENDSGTYAFVEFRAPDGRLALSGYLLDGERHGEWLSTWPDLAPQYGGAYRRGLRLGPWIFRLPDGSAAGLLSGEYERGRRRGPAALTADEQRPRAAPPPPELGPLGAPAAPDALEKSLDLWLGADERALARLEAELADPRKRPAWLAERARAFPSVLRRLAACDVETPAGRAALARLALALRHLCGGKSLADLGPDGPGSADEAREFVRAWLGLWAALHDEAWLWEVELPLGKDPALLREPPLHELLTRSASPAPPALLAARFEPRPADSLTAPLDLALDWLARNQLADGRWSSEVLADGTESGGRRGHDVGVSALALLALMGAGHTPERGRHAPIVSRGLAYLLAVQDAAKGTIFSVFSPREAPEQLHRNHDWLYEHTLATLALCEALALRPSPALRLRAQQALDVLFAARNPYGAWRYELPPSGESDTSITAWALVTLLTAQMAGLQGDFGPAYDGGLAWIDEVSDPASGRVGYDAVGSLSARTEENQNFPRERGEAMTACALLVRRLLGQTPQSQPLIPGHIELVRGKPPLWDPEGLGIDEYYFYYGAQALALCGEPHRSQWKGALKALTQAQNGNAELRGSWDPLGVWAHVGGRVYSTAMLAMALESPFRYALNDLEAKKRK